MKSPRKRHSNPPFFHRPAPAMLGLVILLLALGLWSPIARSQSEDETPPLTETSKKGVLIGTIDGEIDLVESAFVFRLQEEARAAEVGTVLVELNTFGGRVDAAVAIRDALIDLSNDGIQTAVFINKRAISAGALISLACDKIIISPGGTIGAATPIQQTPGQEMPEPVEEKYLSYFREEMRTTAEVKGRDPDLAEAMVDNSKVIDGVSEEGKLLTLSTKRALELKMADFEAHNLEGALEALGLETAPRNQMERSWSEKLVGFLTSPTISSFLFLCMVIFAYMEYQTPGFGLFGGGAIFCFLILFFSHYLVNLAGWEELILFSLGILLLLIEIFVLPGFGIAGIAGLGCILASAVLLFQAGDFWDFSFSNPFTMDAIQRVLLSVVLGLAVLLLFIRYLPDGSGPGRLILNTSLARAAGYTSLEEDRIGRGATGTTGTTGTMVEPEADPLEGAVGIALTPLRPSGKARLGERRVEVETAGEFVDKGDAVRFVRRRSGRILVRPILDDEGGR